MVKQVIDCQKPVRPLIILVDRDEIYRSRVARRLTSILHVPVIGLDPQGNLLTELENCLGSPNTVCTAGQTDGQGLENVPDRDRVLVLADPVSCRFLESDPQVSGRLQLVEWLEHPQQGSDLPFRLMPMNQLATWLKSLLPEPAADSSCPSPPGHEIQASGQKDVTSPEDSARNSLMVTLDLGWPQHHEWISRQIKTNVAAGCRVIYLPLMPTYRMELLQQPGRGPNLTALILRLANGEELSPDDLGIYQEPHPNGFWQFRPPDRADDLIQANLPALHELISLLRRKVWQNLLASPELVLVDCSGLPLRTVTALAVMADTLAVRFETSKNWAGSVGQRELGAILAKLPSTCKIVEMNLHGENRL